MPTQGLRMHPKGLADILGKEGTRGLSDFRFQALKKFPHRTGEFIGFPQQAVLDQHIRPFDVRERCFNVFFALSTHFHLSLMLVIQTDDLDEAQIMPVGSELLKHPLGDA